jgi:hypothetical protein
MTKPQNVHSFYTTDGAKVTYICTQTATLTSKCV